MMCIVHKRSNKSFQFNRTKANHKTSSKENNRKQRHTIIVCVNQLVNIPFKIRTFGFNFFTKKKTHLKKLKKHIKKCISKWFLTTKKTLDSFKIVIYTNESIKP